MYIISYSFSVIRKYRIYPKIYSFNLYVLNPRYLNIKLLRMMTCMDGNNDYGLYCDMLTPNEC